MKLSVTQENLARALSATGRVASSRTPLPVLNNILLRTDNNRLVVAATNLEIAVTLHIGAKIENTGAITVPAKLTSEFVSNLPRGTVELEVDGTHLQLKSGNFSSKINGVDADEFPEIPTISDAVEISVKADVLKRAVAQTVIAASSDNTRPILTGIFIHSYDGTLYLVGTDGYRLAERALGNAEHELSAIIPSSTLQEVLRVVPEGTDEITMLFDDNQVHFRLKDVEVTSRLIDGKFPDYRKLIPDTSEVTVEIDKSEFVRIVKIASLFARESNGSITLRADSASNKLTINSIASQLGENTSDADAKVSGDAQVTLNSRYVLDALGSIDADSVMFKFSGKLAACIFRASSNSFDYQHIVMPLKS